MTIQSVKSLNVRILLVDDDESMLFAYSRSLAQEGYTVQTAVSLADAKTLAQPGDFEALILDLGLPDGNALEWIPEVKRVQPDLPIIVLTATNDVPTVVAAMKYGAENFLVKPVETETFMAVLYKVIEVGKLRRQERVRRRMNKTIEPFMGKSVAIDTIRTHLDLAINNDMIVLLTGETGTGKGVLARWIHEQGNRRDGTFVEMNCSCLKGDLLRSELFGHTRGSFTSAIADREGLVELADKGTLFLDEIGDMDLAVQAQMLKTLEERTYRRVGDNRIRKSNFRLICATNKDVLKETETGGFRKDLYYRICVFPVFVPPLRERLEDIEGLATYILAESGYPFSSLNPAVVDLLMMYQWPGNIRELRNMLERAVLLARGSAITVECFPGMNVPEMAVPVKQTGKLSGLREQERDYLLKTVASCSGDKKKASEILGISLATLYRKLNPHTVPE